jgi:hypothetical protein
MMSLLDNLCITQLRKSVFTLYNPEIVYIKGTANILADTVSRLEYIMEINIHGINVHISMKALARLLNSYVETILNSNPF